MIKSRLLSNFKNISHGFFNSEGGYSNGIYKSLNCGIGSKDKKRRVLLNLKKVSKRIKVANNNLVLLNQIHSNKVKFVNKNTLNRFVGDGLVTNKKNLALGILTADCAPILIFDPKKQNIAALHAGWKGAYKDIIKNTLTTPSPFSTENLLAFQPPIRVPIPRHKPYGKSTKPLKKKVKKAPIVYTRTITTLVAFTRIKFNLL